MLSGKKIITAGYIYLALILVMAVGPIFLIMHGSVQGYLNSGGYSLLFTVVFIVVTLVILKASKSMTLQLLAITTVLTFVIWNTVFYFTPLAVIYPIVTLLGVNYERNIDKSK